MITYSNALYNYKFMLIDKIYYPIYIQIKTTWVMYEREYHTVNILHL